MDKLRTGIEGYELPQNSNTLIDDINCVVANRASNYFYYFWMDSHHIMGEEERQLRKELNPRELYYIPPLRKGFPPCPQIRWKGYRNG